MTKTINIENQMTMDITKNNKKYRLTWWPEDDEFLLSNLDDKGIPLSGDDFFDLIDKYFKENA